MFEKTWSLSWSLCTAKCTAKAKDVQIDPYPLQKQRINSYFQY